MAELNVAEKTKQALANLGTQEPVYDVTPGQSMLQTRSSFQTAVSVIRPRNLEQVLHRCTNEAMIAGDEFFYAWKQGGESIEGLTVGAALSIVRNFGNCAVEVKVTELPTSYLFEGVFVDLETGFNLVRPFRQNKQSPKKRDGDDIYKGDRGADIIFQIGASKAIRNVVLNAVPKWIASKVMEQAKENVLAKFEKLGIEKVKALIFRRAEAQGIAAARIEGVYGKEKAWDIETAVKIASAIRAIEDGTEKAEELFPMVSDADPRTATAEAKTEAKVETKAAPAPSDEAATPAEVIDESTGEISQEATQEPTDDIPLEAVLLSQIEDLVNREAPLGDIQVWYQRSLTKINDVKPAKVQKTVMDAFKAARDAAKARA